MRSENTNGIWIENVNTEKGTSDDILEFELYRARTFKTLLLWFGKSSSLAPSIVNKFCDISWIDLEFNREGDLNTIGTTS